MLSKSSHLSVRGGRPTNQDSVLDSFCCWGVFDGHGLHGAEAADAARDTIGAALLRSSQQQQQQEVLVNAFAEAQQRVIALAAEPLTEDEREFGTTAAVAVASSSSSGAADLTCAWVGDSRILLCRIVEVPPDGSSSSSRGSSRRRSSLRGSCDGRASVVFSSVPHTLFDASEVERVVIAGGKVVERSPTLRRVIPGDIPLEEVQSKRIALNMSRALGHVTLSRCGVSSIPSLAERVPLCSGDRLVLASDGLSEEITNDRVAELVCAASTPSLAAQALLKEAQKVDERLRRLSDNITIIVVFFSEDTASSRALHPPPTQPGSPVPPEIEQFSQ